MTDNRTAELLREAEREIVILRDKLRIANGTGAKTCVKCGAFLSDELLCTECAIAAWNTRHERTCEFSPDGIGDGKIWSACSMCGGYVNAEYDPPRYCPHCGAKVVGE